MICMLETKKTDSFPKANKSNESVNPINFLLKLMGDLLRDGVPRNPISFLFKLSYGAALIQLSFNINKMWF